MAWTDLRDVLQEACLDTFAETDADGVSSVSYEVDGGAQTVIRGIYLDSHLEELFETARAPNSTQEVKVDVKIADLPHYPPVYRTDRIVLRRKLAGDPRDSSEVTRFELVDHRPDGQGLVRLILRVSR